jgi:hypothetical protein
VGSSSDPAANEAALNPGSGVPRPEADMKRSHVRPPVMSHLEHGLEALHSALRGERKRGDRGQVRPMKSLAYPARCELLRHNPAAVESGRVLDELAALEQELTGLREQEESNDSALAALEAEASERRDQLETIRDAGAEHERRVEEIRRKLRVADEASEAYERSVVARDSVAQSVTEAIERFLEELAELDHAEEEAESAWRSAEARAREAGSSPTRPRDAGTDHILRDGWERLRTEIRTRSHEQFEDDLVDAAVRSPMGHAISDLPTHLRELARQRRRRFIQNLS